MKKWILYVVLWNVFDYFEIHGPDSWFFHYSLKKKIIIHYQIIHYSYIQVWEQNLILRNVTWSLILWKKSFMCLLTSLLIKKVHFCFCFWPQFISVSKLKQFCSLEHKQTVNKKPPGSETTYIWSVLHSQQKIGKIECQDIEILECCK